MCPNFRWHCSSFVAAYEAVAWPSTPLVRYNPRFIQEDSDVPGAYLPPTPDFASHSPFGGAFWLQRPTVDLDQSVIIRVTDRGPFVPDRILDLSMAFAKAIGVWRSGVARVRIDVYAEATAHRGTPKQSGLRKTPPEVCRVNRSLGQTIDTFRHLLEILKSHTDRVEP